jgi:hypothetical protein
MKRFFCLLAVALITRGDTLLRKVEGDRTTQIAMRADPGEFSEAYVEHLATAELRRHPRSRFVQLLIYGSKGGPPLSKPDHVSFDYWRRMYETSVGSPNELAEMISIGNDAVLRVHGAAGNVSVKVLSGKNPLVVRVGDGTFEIVHFSFSTSMAYGKQADVYLRTASPLADESGLAVLQRLQALFPDLRVSVSVRNDAWFIFERTYPFCNPLVTRSAPPTAEEYSQTKTMVCEHLTDVASCRLE